jgi:hypothetical protein
METLWRFSEEFLHMVFFNRTHSRWLFDSWSLAGSADDVLRALHAGGEECSAVVKSTVLRAIKAGRISGTKDEQCEWHVEPAELHRVYPPRRVGGRSSGAVPRSPFSIFGIA